MIALFQAIQVEARSLDEIRNVPVEMASSGESLPVRRNPILPPPDARFWRGAMFEKEKPPSWRQNPAYFLQRYARIRDRAQRERGDHAVEAVIIHWYAFSR